MTYNLLLRQAVHNLQSKYCVARTVPTQSVQALHFQTCKMTEKQFNEYQAKGTAKTVYALDYIIKFKPENIHDNGHYLAIMFQGEKVYERKRKHWLDFGFYLARRDFLRAYREIKEYHANKKRAALSRLLG